MFKRMRQTATLMLRVRLRLSLSLSAMGLHFVSYNVKLRGKKALLSEITVFVPPI
jgi:hypothetical protein